MIKDPTTKLKEPKEPKLLWTLDVVGYQVPVYEALLNVWGVFDKETREVFINRKITGGPLAECDTMLHETIHVAENIGLADQDRLAERQVNTLSYLLTNILWRNKGLRDYLWERLEGKK